MSSPATEPRPRVLIGAAGTTTAFGIVRALRGRWGAEIEILATDINPRSLVAAAALADRFLQAPPVVDPGYAGWLERTLRETEPTLFVPLLDEDIATSAELAEAGELPPATRLLAPSAASARICWDKFATWEWLRERGLPGCETWEPGEASWAGAPLVAKARRGQGSQGFRRLDSAAELAALAGAGDLVVQPLCEPPEVTVDAFLAADGSRFRAVCRERLETKAGVCTKARVHEDAELAGLAEEVARGLDLHGASCLQAMRGEDGGWRLTDVNARAGAGTPLAAAAGVDLLGAAFADLLDLPFDFERETAPLADDVYAVRQLHEYVVE
ncbi:MAG TPA: ATP-grasp domain-containing protein [Solirubrobacterales bacterium]|jgi:carbamoylphosphate synthase large subunit|nr:ATP-grasp domain-containing protein [Solirubrobacterales bacterium]